MKSNVGALAFCLWMNVYGVANGEEFYRRESYDSFQGANQGNVGSCSAEAQTAALNNAFRLKNIPLRFSSFYGHVANWIRKPDVSKEVSLMQEFDASDLALVEKFGPIAPAALYPENSAGYNPYNTGMRPHLNQVLTDIDGVPNAVSHGFQRIFSTFKPGFQNSIGIPELKTQIKDGNAVTLGLIGEVLMDRFDWDHATGFLNEKYTWEKLAKIMADEESPLVAQHAVALVGFDDELYKEMGYEIPGAVIIRNSWNDAKRIKASYLAQNDESLADKLKLMKRKIHPSIVLPGYYAVPMQVVKDLIDHAVENSGTGFISFNYTAYGNQAVQAIGKVEELITPFLCEPKPKEGWTPRHVLISRAISGILTHLKTFKDTSKPEVERRVGYIKLKKKLQAEAQYKAIGSPLFNYARQSRTPGSDHALDFYSGKFDSYYCGGETEHVWPRKEHYEQAAYQASILALTVAPEEPDLWLKYFQALEKIGALELEAK